MPGSFILNFQVTSLSDCVSLEHLGEFLTILCRINRFQAHPKRELPDVCFAGRPNLIICAADIMWRTVLSIYMTSSEQPLPSATEVLICSENTTGEEVELLLRRAIIQAPNKGTVHLETTFILRKVTRKTIFRVWLGVVSTKGKSKIGGQHRTHFFAKID